MKKSQEHKISKVLIIAEVGQNHQGDLALAKKYIREFSKLGADIIKFQARNNKTLFSKEAFNMPYISQNSFAESYGKHREKLELSFKDLQELKNECKKNKVKFMITPFDEISLKNIIKIGVDYIKIASFDLGNLPFIDLIAKKKKPVVISTGGGNLHQIQSSIKILLKQKIKVILLHCVSMYPCKYDNLSLGHIKILKKKFPNCTVGLSDHFNGILSGPLAYMNGARVFEKHVTFDRSWTGSDHGFALEPNGFRKFCRDIRRTPMMISEKLNQNLGKEKVFKKLGKSIVLNEDMKKGKIIKIKNLSGMIFTKNHVLVRYSEYFIGKKLKLDIKKNVPLKFSDVKR